MNTRTLKKSLKKHYLFLILFATIQISLFTTILNLSRSVKNEKRSMNESLEQAQINIQTHMTMAEDYLSLTHANPVIQSRLLASPKTQGDINGNINSLNDILFSVDLFKKTISSMQLFAFDKNNIYPSYNNGTRYNNAVFSIKDLEKKAWYNQTLRLKGKTYWFIDDTDPNSIVISASRVILNNGSPSNGLGLLRANIPIDKYIDHLNSISFGNKGNTFLLTEQNLYAGGTIHKTNSYPLREISDQASKYLRVNLPIKNTHWQIVGMISYRELYRDGIYNLLLILLIFLLTAGIASLLCLRFSNKLSKPIEILCSQMSTMNKAFSTGNSNTSCLEITQLYSTYNTMLEDMNHLMATREAAVTKLKEAELTALQSQINPHFIYNTFESMNALISMKETQKAAQMISSLSSFLRNSLNHGNDKILLSGEIEQVISYFHIQKIRYSERIQMNCTLPEQLGDFKIIKLILQPLVENSILHGFQGISYTGEIQLTVSEDETWLILQVADNGIGSDIELLNEIVNRPPDQEDNLNFYCIQNIQRRLTYCYGNSSGLSYVENEPGGITARIQIEKCAL